jgi:hypothetical protein
VPEFASKATQGERINLLCVLPTFLTIALAIFAEADRLGHSSPFMKASALFLLVAVLLFAACRSVTPAQAASHHYNNCRPVR